MSVMDSDRLTKDDVLSRFDGAVSPTQLERWQKAGLIPSPRRHGLGRGKGTVSLYDPRVIPMLSRVLDLQSTTRDIREWRWQLWLDGYPIDVDVLCTDLLERVTAMQHKVDFERAQRRRAEMSELEEMEEWAELFKTIGGSFLRRLQRKVKDRHEVHSVLVFISSQILGYESPLEWDERYDGASIEDLVAKIMGMTSVNRSSAQLSPNFSLRMTRETISESSLLEWRTIRRDWQTVTAAIDTFEFLVRLVKAPMVPQDEIGPDVEATMRLIRRLYRDYVRDVARLSHDPSFRAMFSALLLWLRRGPFASNVDEIMKALRSWSASINLVRVDKPSRRVQPSEGTTSGRTSSRCTPMISATEKSETES